MPVTFDVPLTANLAWPVFFEASGDLPTDSQLQLWAEAALAAIPPGDTRLAIEGWRHQMPMDLQICRVSDLPFPLPELLQSSCWGHRERARFDAATHVALVLASDVLCAPRPGFWASVTVARALARRLGGILVDLDRMVGHGVDSLELLPPPDGTIHMRDWFGILASLTDDGYELRTTALHRWGLPNLVLRGVPTDAAIGACTALDGAAWALASKVQRHAGRRVEWKQVTVYEGHVARVMGKPQFHEHSGSRVRMGITALDDATAGPEWLLHHRRGPDVDPAGFAMELARKLGADLPEVAYA